MRAGALVMTSVALWAFANGAQSGATHYSPSLNYTMHCQGCHKSDGTGQPGFVPALKGSVAKFLAVTEGREYLVRVPGTAQSMLNDRDAADVLNWIVRTFDPEHLPAEFVPYDEREVAHLRRSPISQSAAERARIVGLLEAEAKKARSATLLVSADGAVPHSSASATARAPDAFAVCAACHPLSAGGEHGMGPNLRGVMGRRAGSAANYSFSKAMRDSGIVWSKAELDDFVRDASGKIPGTLMGFGGVSDPADRRAIIEYLDAIR